MNRERFERIEGIFHEAVQLEGDARRDFLEEACAGDAALRRDVEMLLANDVDEGVHTTRNLIDQVPALLADAVAADSEHRSAEEEATLLRPLPERIGRYRILDKIGEGGMGTVYLAEQDDPRRRVALKMIRPDLMSSSLYRRFQFETQVLGRLQHPGIAQIYEAGRVRSETGPLPYFAMEYVDGETLKHYIKERKLGIRARLELVARICDAAFHAHQKGIVHRDLKPENVLVVEEGHTTTSVGPQGFAELGQPKILDFGIARATDADVQMTTLHTDVGKLMGTITYMSPEQVVGDSRRIDMRSDIYALGTLLYEVLAGHPPFDMQNKPITEAARIIREDEPTRLGSIDTVLRGDIETIVGKALDKEPERRYGSAADLAADIRRYLADEPILARAPSMFYELNKFARRHRGLVAGLAFAFLILVIGIISSLSFALRARRNEETALRTAYQMKIAMAQSSADTEPLQALDYLESIPVQRRAWEWHHHYARIVTHVGEQKGDRFRRYTSTLACRKDGSPVAALNRAGSIEIVDLVTGEVHAALRDQNALEVLCLSADATILCAWCEQNREVLLWDVQRKERLGVFPLEVNDPICRLAGDNCLWAIRSSKGSRLTVIDAVSGRTTWEYEHPADARHDFALSPHAKGIVLEVDGKLHLFTNTGNLVTSNGLKEVLSSVAFSPDGKRMALGHIHRRISILHADTLEEQKVLFGHSGEVTAVAFTPDGSILASTALDNTVRIWEVDSGRTLGVLPLSLSRHAESLAFSRDGIWLAAGNAAGVRIWRWREDSRSVMKAHDFYAYQASFNPDGTLLASAGFMNAEVCLWDPFTGENLAIFPAAYPSKGVEFSEDGSRLVFQSPTTDYMGRCNFTIMDTGTGSRLTSPRLSGDKGLFEMLHRQPDFLEIAGHSRCSPESGQARVSSADGSLIADGYRKREILLLDPRTRKTLKCIGHHDATILALAFSPNSALILSGDGNGVVKVWDIDSGNERALLAGHADKVYSICFHPDGTRIATGANDGHVMIWDAETFERVAVLREHTSYVHSVHFSPDGTMLASASGDGTVRIWDTVLRSGRWQQIQEIKGLRKEAVPLVERLLIELKDPLDVADHLRTLETLTEPQRRASLRVLLKKSRSNKKS